MTRSTDTICLVNWGDGDYNMQTNNGLQLRADTHTSFERGLLWIHPDDLTVQIAEALKTTEYAQLAGKVIVLPSDSKHHPLRKHLQGQQRYCLGR